jgi:hypothetical protein
VWDQLAKVRQAVMPAQDAALPPAEKSVLLADLLHNALNKFFSALSRPTGLRLALHLTVIGILARGFNWCS